MIKKPALFSFLSVVALVLITSCSLLAPEEEKDPELVGTVWKFTSRYDGSENETTNFPFVNGPEDMD